MSDVPACDRSGDTSFSHFLSLPRMRLFLLPTPAPPQMPTPRSKPPTPQSPPGWNLKSPPHPHQFSHVRSPTMATLQLPITPKSANMSRMLCRPSPSGKSGCMDACHWSIIQDQYNRWSCCVDQVNIAPPSGVPIK